MLCAGVSLSTQVSANLSQQVLSQQQSTQQQQLPSYSGSAATSTPQFLSPLNSIVRRSTTEGASQEQLGTVSTFESIGSQQPAAASTDKHHFTAAVAAAAAGKRLYDRLKEGTHDGTQDTLGQ